VNESAEELEHDIERLRDGMTKIAHELDVRRHELFDWRLQLRRHSTAVLIAAGSVVLLAGGTVALTLWSKSRRERPLNRVKRVWEAAAVKPEPGVGEKVLAAAAIALIGVAAKAVAERLFAPVKRAAKQAGDGAAPLSRQRFTSSPV